MAEEKIDYKWDGDNIVQTISIAPIKRTPKEILDTIYQVKNNIAQMEEQLRQFESNKEATENKLKGAKEFLSGIEGFGDDCEKLQVEKLKLIISQKSDEWKKKAEEDAQRQIESINTNGQKLAPDGERNIKFTSYQRFMATDEKVANKISSVIIKKHIYEKPIYDNPFK